MSTLAKAVLRIAKSGLLHTTPSGSEVSVIPRTYASSMAPVISLNIQNGHGDYQVFSFDLSGEFPKDFRRHLDPKALATLEELPDAQICNRPVVPEPELIPYGRRNPHHRN